MASVDQAERNIQAIIRSVFLERGVLRNEEERVNYTRKPMDYLRLQEERTWFNIIKIIAERVSNEHYDGVRVDRDFSKETHGDLLSVTLRRLVNMAVGEDGASGRKSRAA